MWEYKYVQVQWDGSYKDADGSSEWDVHISELGALGWEFVAMQGTPVPGENVVNMLFRRERRQAAVEVQPELLPEVVPESRPEREPYDPLDF